MKKILGTYRGYIDKSHYLNDPDKIIKAFYKESYLNGRITESTYDKEGVERDKDSSGNEVSRDFEIGNENRQRAKVLSSKAQREERLNLIATNKANEATKQLALKEIELKRYNHNTDCEDRIASLFNAIENQPKSTTSNQTSNKAKLSIQL